MLLDLRPPATRARLRTSSGTASSGTASSGTASMLPPPRLVRPLAAGHIPAQPGHEAPDASVGRSDDIGTSHESARRGDRDHLGEAFGGRHRASTAPPRAGAIAAAPSTGPAAGRPPRGRRRATGRRRRPATPPSPAQPPPGRSPRCRRSHRCAAHHPQESSTAQSGDGRAAVDDDAGPERHDRVGHGAQQPRGVGLRNGRDGAPPAGSGDGASR